MWDLTHQRSRRLWEPKDRPRLSGRSLDSAAANPEPPELHLPSVLSDQSDDLREIRKLCSSLTFRKCAFVTSCFDSVLLTTGSGKEKILSCWQLRWNRLLWFGDQNLIRWMSNRGNWDIKGTASLSKSNLKKIWIILTVIPSDIWDEQFQVNTKS